MNSFYDIELDRLEKELEAGLITQEEFNLELRDLERDARERAQEAAQDAYDRTLEDYGW